MVAKNMQKGVTVVKSSIRKVLIKYYYICWQRLIKRSDKVLRVNEKLCDELLYGRVGYAYALLFVKVKISSDLISNGLLHDVI